MIISGFQDFQADEVSSVIKRNLLEIISNYYSPAYVSFLVDSFSPTNILKNAKRQHIFVASEDGKVIGTGSLANYGSTEKPIYYGTAIFVAPEFQRKGVGRQLMQKVELKAVEMGAEKIAVRAAINAREFYEKLGYFYRDGIEVPDEKGNFIMEKTLQREQ